MIRSFKTADEMFEHMRAQRRELDERLEQWQLNLRPGDFAVSVWEPPMSLPVTLYYELIESEYEEDRQRLAEDPAVALVRGYSIIEPKGEMGSVHRANFCFQLSAEQWAAAKERGWPPLF